MAGSYIDMCHTGSATVRPIWAICMKMGKSALKLGKQIQSFTTIIQARHVIIIENSDTFHKKVLAKNLCLCFKDFVTKSIKKVCLHAASQGNQRVQIQALGQPLRGPAPVLHY